ncbi:MAG: adenosylcobinamide-GDP ribazoletransferase [Acidimicrobiia bacterium]|nr:adenosylcobinamide-GDP ribazoletransferase [Acidimicrobiia bacterium]MYC57936.1 adenosylcobinamide-GDP ribazoletransferase [Acidimicrobiia bacterium]MYI31239.1 adenosylcobinamide-GDP ribazoletransferase [Acidimicrobiia bacterium]
MRRTGAMSAVAFLTVAGRGQMPHAKTLWWFPLVGAGLGAVLAAIHWGASELWPLMVVGILLVAADLILTGALHLDGLADSADGLLPHMERDRRLAVMNHPDVGAFAIATVVVVLGARWAALSVDSIESLSLIPIWALSRTVVAVTPAIVPYARPGGLADPFLAGTSLWLALWLVPAIAGLVLIEGVTGTVAAGVAVMASAGIATLAWRKLGGFTGDVLGSVILIAETAALLALVTKP